MNDTIREIHPGDPEWPAGLADLGAAQMPQQLWLRGAQKLAALTESAIAIVGARAATAYGGHVASDLAYHLAADYTVVSGGAFGIDALAHRGALAAERHTIVVLACGVDVAYPRTHQQLFDRIAVDGLLVSEYPPGTTPRPERFLARNRIIAALTLGTVVVEASMRSGSMNTARHAYELGRRVMAVPGPVTSATSAGCHSLIRNGATLVTSHGDVVAALEA